MTTKFILLVIIVENNYLFIQSISNSVVLSEKEDEIIKRKNEMWFFDSRFSVIPSAANESKILLD